MIHVFMLLVLISGIASVANSYMRSTGRPNYRPARGAHLPPLVVGGVCFGADLVYAAMDPMLAELRLFDIGFLVVGLACMIATVVLLWYDPMRR
jgi:hypothetical protein